VREPCDVDHGIIGSWNAAGSPACFKRFSHWANAQCPPPITMRSKARWTLSTA
jgi:hypothetical protein